MTDAASHRAPEEGPPPAPPVATELTTTRTLNIPNLITLSRLVLAFVVLVLIDFSNAWIPATLIFIFAVATDFLDGYLARKWNQVTALGRIMDPFVDKVIIGGTLIFLIPHESSGVCPWIAFAVIAREMFVTGLRSVLEGHGVDFSAKFSGKLKMCLQSVAIPLCLLSLSPRFSSLLGSYSEQFVLVRNVMLYAMLIVTIYSGVEYIWRAYLLMQHKPAERGLAD